MQNINTQKIEDAVLTLLKQNKGSFKVSDFNWNHLNTNPVMYGATAIKLEEW